MLMPFGSMPIAYVFAPSASKTPFATEYEEPFAQSRPTLTFLNDLVASDIR